MAAHSIDANCATFYPTGLHVEPGSFGNVVRHILNPVGANVNAHRIKLCKPDKTAATPDSSLILKEETFDAFRPVQNIQAYTSVQIVSFACAQGMPCAPFILAISGWLPSGHGALVRPFVFTLDNFGNKPLAQYIPLAIEPVGPETLVCKNGFTVNAAGNDCVSISGDGGGRGDAGGNNNNNNPSPPECPTGQAFRSLASRTCIPCGETRQSGIRANGECVQCERGRIFNRSSGGCDVATREFSRSRMYFGANPTASLEDQCWMKSDTEYRNCVRKR
jgi:hypothetical protein